MTMQKVLLVEHDETVRNSLKRQWQERCDVSVAGSCAEAQKAMVEETFDLIVLDVNLPDDPSARLLAQIGTYPQRTLVVMLAPLADIESAVEGLRQGAFAFLLKPVSPAQLDAVLMKAADHSRRTRASRYLAGAGIPEFIGQAPAITQLRGSIRRVARTDATVLIQGEPGTGKQLMGRTIHRDSERAGSPLIHVDCANLSEQAAESALFGGGNGAGGRDGAVALAQGGTLLLEEVGALSRAAQERLLGFLEAQERTRADVRFLATSSRDLNAKPARAGFSEELFHALNIVPFHLPPLRDRAGDIVELAAHFRQRSARRLGREVLAIAPATLEALQRYSWPGNVRELRSVIERAVLACPGRILEADALRCSLGGGLLPAAGVPQSAPRTLVDAEKLHIFAVLAQCGDNRTHAARHLGISLRTLRNKLREYRLKSTPATVTRSATHEVAA